MLAVLRGSCETPFVGDVGCCAVVDEVAEVSSNLNCKQQIKFYLKNVN